MLRPASACRASGDRYLADHDCRSTISPELHLPTYLRGGLPDEAKRYALGVSSPPAWRAVRPLGRPRQRTSERWRGAARARNDVRPDIPCFMSAAAFRLGTSFLSRPESFLRQAVGQRCAGRSTSAQRSPGLPPEHHRLSSKHRAVTLLIRVIQRSAPIANRGVLPMVPD